MLRLRTARRALRVGVIACDLDRTLTDRHLRVVPSALAALALARRAGARTVLVTGRGWRELRRRPRLLESFDVAVCEGGAVSGPMRRRGPDAATPPALLGFAGWLGDHGIPHRRGVAAVSIGRRHLGRARRYPGFARLAPHANRDRVDVTARGVDKGTGLRAALRQLRPRPRGAVLAFGDAANDAALFRVADYAVAVSNAEPALKRNADEVTRGYGGRGVARFLQARLEYRSAP